MPKYKESNTKNPSKPAHVIHKGPAAGGSVKRGGKPKTKGQSNQGK